MSVKILANTIIDLEQFRQDPQMGLEGASEGTLAVLKDHRPVMYAVTAERLSELLAAESMLNQRTDITLDAQFFNEPTPQSVALVGKFPLYPDWQPDNDFIRQAAQWGIALTQPVTEQELAAFVAYWQAEGRMFHHVQWQQKLARYLQMNRMKQVANKRQDFTQIDQPDRTIPKGFRG